MEQIKTKENDVGNKLSDFEIIKELGKGSYATVYKVKSHLNSNIYVMKKMELNHLKPRQQQECYREVSILRKVSHQHIIKYYSSFLENEVLYIIMEYAELGDLYSLIKHYKRHSKYFDEIDLWRIASDILSGLEYLHSQKIIHRDIKCLNLFITKDRHIKIGDLGVSTITSGMDNLHYTRVGTPLYISPELVKQKPYDYKTDIWSFGCSLYHLASLEPPFSGGNLIVLGNNIVKGVPKSLPHQYSNELRAYIDKMLEKKPEKRPSAKEALELIPMEIKEKISSNGDKFQIKSKRPFSSVMNKIITVNKNEMRNLFGDKNKIKNKHKQNNFFEINKNSKNNKNFILNSSAGNIITIHDLDKINNNGNDINQNNNNNNIIQSNNIQKDNEIKIKENKKSEFKAIFASNEKEKTLHRNKNNTIENNQYDSASNLIPNTNNKIKKSKNISVDTPSVGVKKIYDLSFNIPSFNNQKGFNNFRNKKKNFDDILSENKFTLCDKNNSNYNYIKIFSPLFKNSTYFDLKKNKNNHFIQNNLIEQNNNQNNIKKIENKISTQNTIRNIIEINKNINKNKESNKNIPYNTESNINIINYDNKNINIININNDNNKNNANINNENNNMEKQEKNVKTINAENKNDLMRLNTDITKNKSKENIKFPELNIKDKSFNNFIKKSLNNNTNNNININKNSINTFINSNMTNLSSNRNIYKRLTSAKPNARSFSNRPFTSKINKIPMTFNNNINFDNDTFNNIKRNYNNMNSIMFYTKGNSQTDSHRNYSENLATMTKKTNFRPMTGIKPQINNNVMNININFYNIDMNKRFLIPEINPYCTGNGFDSDGNNIMDQLTEESLIQTKKFKDNNNIINNMDLESYKNSNEFLFEKIMKAIKDINGHNNRLTINDLK